MSVAHGTYSSYVRGCHCRDCRYAMAEYRRIFRARGRPLDVGCARCPAMFTTRRGLALHMTARHARGGR